MRTGRPIPPLTITDEERATLERWARRPTTAQAVAQRARLILRCAAGTTNTRVARDLHLTKQTVGKWRARFLAKRLDGLLDEPRPGAPRTVSDTDVERVLTRTLETKPADATHWSIRSMAQACGLSRSTVNRIWHAFALQPHRSETFKLSKDPLFIEKVRDVVGLYLNPPDRALVLCVDEKSQIQALDRTQPLLPLRLGQAELRSATRPPSPSCGPRPPMRSSLALLVFVIESLGQDTRHSSAFLGRMMTTWSSGRRGRQRVL
jgi:DNA-binding XRE family transcriptional regulator